MQLKPQKHYKRLKKALFVYLTLSQKKGIV